MTKCDHQNVFCINQFELIRKYECADCGAVMMCNCDKDIGQKFLSHQLAFGKRLETQEEVQVTEGFIGGMCNECRGLPATPCPAAAIMGRTSKIKRYYWRELAFREYALYEEFGGSPENYIYKLGENEPEIIRKARTQALADIKALHATNPKYHYDEESNESFINRMGVQVRDVQGVYINDNDRKAKIAYQGELLTVEQYAEKYYEGLGYKAVRLESMPFHALFSIFTWLLIQDPNDPEVRMAGFGERSAYEEDRSKNPIWVPLPSDFGTSGYADRRKKEIEAYLSDIQEHSQDLLWLFDYWTPYSEGLRQYLWAHRNEHVQKARKIVEILEPRTTLEIIHYLLGSYWSRYLGWPDLLAYNKDAYLFVEVKLSKDKLSDEQRHWIEENKKRLHLPFEILKVHRVAAQHL
ncbi:MAG: VRR-NUC domain-containing protein [Proteobacteria bacterium]|nr:VRR-NUC domain-containing protein [Pseudomonadota bacterium]